MRRRTMLAAGLAIPAAGLAGSAMASAATSYYVAATEQVSNRVTVWSKNVAFTNANLHWSFSAGGSSAWSNLSDIKVRDTSRYGLIALVTASGGRVGAINVTSKKATSLADLKWSAAPGGNPHAIERIPNNGSVVVASSAGRLTVYAPSSSALGSLAQVQTIAVSGAHGVLWDPTYKLLWVSGQDWIRAYSVSGSWRNTRLKYSKHVSLGSNLGHDLQPDYSDRSALLCTATHGVYRLNTASLALTRISSETRVKAYAKHSSGEAVSIRADNTGARTWGSPTIRFSASPDRTRSGAEFYKVRIWDSDFE